MVRGFCTEANDPERYLADWLRAGAPIGVARPIPESGIFPATAKKAPIADLVSSIYAWSGGRANDAGVREHQQIVEAELDRLVSKGYIVKYDTWDEPTEVSQEVVVSKLAAIIKVRPGGTIKLRLIVGMLCSGLNDFVKHTSRGSVPTSGRQQPARDRHAKAHRDPLPERHPRAPRRPTEQGVTQLTQITNCERLASLNTSKLLRSAKIWASIAREAAPTVASSTTNAH